MKKKAIILIGFQKDYFDKDGILHGVVEDSLTQLNVLDKTVNVIKGIQYSKADCLRNMKKWLKIINFFKHLPKLLVSNF